MSTITNEPILLDSTGRKLVDRMDRQNSLLAMIAEGHRSDVYNNIGQIANIVRGNDVDMNKRIFPIGDQIIHPWIDVDDNNKEYLVAHNIVHHGLVELVSGEIVPGMFLQWHYCTPYGVQFSHQQAFMNCPEGLAAGTYHVTLGYSWGSKDAVVGTSWSFILTQPVPAGGRLSGFEGMPDVAASTWRVKSWALATDANPIETVVVTSGTDGTYLGTLAYNRPGEEGLNSMQAVAYGHNRWSTSAIRQYMNTKGADWFKSKEDFDIRPDQYGKNGFMSGYSDDFLAAVKPVKVTTALNTVDGHSNTTEDTFDTFFLASLEQMNGTPQLANVEGPYFEYWRRRLGLNGFAATGSANIYENYKIPAINAQTSPQSVRLRSASRTSANRAWHVNSSGYLSSYYGSASYAYRFLPVCVIC